MLIGQYQTELTLEDDPQRKGRYQLRIEQLKKLLEGYQQELNELQDEGSVNQTYKVNKISTELQHMNVQINALGNFILKSHASLKKQLSQSQFDTIQIILNQGYFILKMRLSVSNPYLHRRSA